MGTTQLKYTPNSTSTRYKATISAWVKRTNIGAEGWIFEGKNGTNQADGFRFQANNTINMLLNDGGGGSCTTNRLFRDPHAFYHLMWVVDTTQATASDRMKLYVNGVQETSFSSASYPAQNFAIEGTFANGQDMYIGTQHGYNYFEGVMSHYHICDGYAYQPSDFGSTDAVTGEWKINTSPSVSYGTHGAFILKDGNSVTDQSGNSNNWSVHGGTLTNTLDNPSNNFCTMSPIMQPINSSLDVFKYGNLFCGGSSSVSDLSACGSIGVKTGKWYWEIKIEDADNTRNLGIVRADKINISTTFGFYVGSAGNSTTTAFTAGLRGSDGVFINKAGGSQTNTDISTTFTTGDIMAIALDLTSSTKTIQFYKNGSASGSAQTLDNAFVDDFVLPACRLDGGQTVTFNFGQGFFGTTAITTNSGNGYAGAEGKSKFNYQPPTGHSALTTKGLNE